MEWNNFSWRSNLLLSIFVVICAFKLRIYMLFSKYQKCQTFPCYQRYSILKFRPMLMRIRKHNTSSRSNKKDTILPSKKILNLKSGSFISPTLYVTVMLFLPVRQNSFLCQVCSLLSTKNFQKFIFVLSLYVQAGCIIWHLPYITYTFSSLSMDRCKCRDPDTVYDEVSVGTAIGSCI